MKKFVALLLVMAMVFALAACGNSGSSDDVLETHGYLSWARWPLDRLQALKDYIIQNKSNTKLWKEIQRSSTKF